MSYVVAFEENGAVKDVTRRYAKAYNAKTRKIRVEMTKGGDLWWWRSLRFYNRGKGIVSCLNCFYKVLTERYVGQTRRGRKQRVGNI